MRSHDFADDGEAQAGAFVSLPRTAPEPLENVLAILRGTPQPWSATSIRPVQWTVTVTSVPYGVCRTAFSTTYTIDGNEITHHVDVSWNESWTGTAQTRIARFEGNRVYLSTPPSLDPITGATSVRTMTWAKLG
jgi:Lipocalin-like domain